MSEHEPQNMSKSELLLLLLGLTGHGGIDPDGIGGITRLQKLLFLLWKEEGIEQVEGQFQFRPYKAGPYSRALYDELELLENLGYVRSEVQGEATEIEAEELDELSFELLMGNDAAPFVGGPVQQQAATADTREERRYSLTPQGVELVNQLTTRDDTAPFQEGIRRVKSKFAKYSLQDLLYHVYTRYEDEGWTSESEIRDKVLRKGRRK